ncbi:unnamed protein product [Rhizoctonia solani]|uniref:Uncharacterized protein n=1 Tax=Rhizoctonia solani TaxID=456999 RepID=A0A8H2XMW3_9AGAM|nr:unnamed protein product [Rhizoctonia solani]
MHGAWIPHRLSGTFQSVRTFSAFFGCPFNRHARIVAFTLSPTTSTRPSRSFSSCCWNVSSLTLSSIAYHPMS